MHQYHIIFFASRGYCSHLRHMHGGQAAARVGNKTFFSTTDGWKYWVRYISPSLEEEFFTIKKYWNKRSSSDNSSWSLNSTLI